MSYKKAKEYVIKSIKELLGPDFKTIQGFTFSSKGLSERQRFHDL